ncbi:MAG TPA: YqhA family protein [Ktedonobacterales bacterium]|nr:YqhA family protein [Ktedonobacterales bacterium]
MDRTGRALSATRYLVLAGVVASLTLSAILFVVILARIVVLIGEIISAVGSEGALKLLAIASIELVDLSLLAAALYIVGLGLFELFIGPVRLPGWLVIASLDDLKSRLISVVVVILATSFLGQVIFWNGTTDLLPLGVAIAVVILALTAFSMLHIGRDERRATLPQPAEPVASTADQATGLADNAAPASRDDLDEWNADAASGATHQR